jgi:hypothetical protein
VENALQSTSSVDAVEAIKNRFANVKKDTKPPSFNKQLCELIVQHHKEEISQRSQHFGSSRSLVEAQNEQREKMLQLDIFREKRLKLKMGFGSTEFNFCVFVFVI